MDTDPGVLGSFPTIENTIRKSYYNPHLLKENEQKQIWTPDRYEGDVDV